MKGQLICKIKDVVSPIMRRDHGQQFLAAIPNTAGTTPNGLPCTSYVKPYLIYEGVVTSDEDILRHLELLHKEGYELLSLDE